MQTPRKSQVPVLGGKSRIVSPQHHKCGGRPLCPAAFGGLDPAHMLIPAGCCAPGSPAVNTHPSIHPPLTHSCTTHPPLSAGAAFWVLSSTVTPREGVSVTARKKTSPPHSPHHEFFSDTPSGLRFSQAHTPGTSLPQDTACTAPHVTAASKENAGITWSHTGTRCVWQHTPLLPFLYSLAPSLSVSPALKHRAGSAGCCKAGSCDSHSASVASCLDQLHLNKQQYINKQL